MTKQVQDAYIVAATRTPVGKAPRGFFRNTRPDDLLAHVLKSVVAQAPVISIAATAKAGQCWPSAVAPSRERAGLRRAAVAVRRARYSACSALWFSSFAMPLSCATGDCRTQAGRGRRGVPTDFA